MSTAPFPPPGVPSQGALALGSFETVRAQYEAFPYPMRDPQDEHQRLIVGSPSHLLEIDHYLFAGRRDFTQPFRVLVAGGGTGDATIMLAQQLADRRCPAEIVYLDLSSASRAVCEQRAQIRGLRNIRFMTASLLDLPSMGLGRFDYIDCTGVLHHLPDPTLAAICESVRSPGMASSAGSASLPVPAALPARAAAGASSLSPDTISPLAGVEGGGGP